MNAHISKSERAEKLAADLANSLKSNKMASSEAMKSFIDEIENSVETPGLEEIAALIALPDEEFALIAPAVLDEMAKAMNDPNDKLLMAQTLNAKGMTIDDLREEYEKIIEITQNELEGQISQQKIDFLKEMMTLNFNAVEDTQGVSKRVMNINIELCKDGAKIPTYAHEGDAGADIYATEDYDIMPGETVIIPTGLKVSIPKGYQFEIRPRSGLSAKTSLRIANAPATIDSNFTGEIGVIAYNAASQFKDLKLDYDESGKCYVKSFITNPPIHIEKGERIAQMVLMEAPVANFVEVETITQNEERGEGAYGSSGKF